MTTFNTLEVWKNEKHGYTIRKKWAIDITKREAEILWEALRQFLNKPDYKREMEEDKAKFI